MMSAHELREQACKIIEKTGDQSDSIDDLIEVPIASIENKSAISPWRSCHGLRLYKSEKVTKALRVILSARLPGMEKSYSEVIESLTDASNCDWEHFIYVWGGTIRDFLRRKAGNDVDIVFTASTAELASICEKCGYPFEIDGDDNYIKIGEGYGDDVMEGMVITHNSANASYNQDFTMNWVFYDFANDVIVDKTGLAVPAIRHNRLEIPCTTPLWDKWVEACSRRVLFRYFKFLVRGYAYDEKEMTYITNRMLRFWTEEPEETIAQGKGSLGSALTNPKTRETLHGLVQKAFELAEHSWANDYKKPCNCLFGCAEQWWESGWLLMLKEPSQEPLKEAITMTLPGMVDDAIGA